MSTVTSSSFIPGTPEATRWRIACPMARSSPPSVRMTTDAEEGWRSRRNEPSSARTICTRAALTERIIWIVRASSPSSALKRVTSCMNDVSPERAELVVEFVADRAAARQAFFRQDHSRGGRLSGRGQNDRALGVDVERHARLAQGGADGGDVVTIEPRIERLHRRAAQIIAREPGRHEGGEADQRQRGQTPDA